MIYQISRDSQTSSSCSQCKKQNFKGDNHRHQHSKSSQSSDEEVSANHIPIDQLEQKQQSRILYILRQQIKNLQKSNEQKDRAIRQLKEMIQRKDKKNLQPQLTKKSSQKVRHILSPQQKVGRILSPKNLKRTQIETEVDFKIILLEKQIKQFQIKVMQLTNKLKDCSESIVWMQKFIISFTQMCQDLSLNYGLKLGLKGINLRKKTKICWKYLKQLINNLIK